MKMMAQYMPWCHFHPASNSSLEDNFKKLLIYFKFTYYIIKPLLLAYAIEDETRCLKKCNPKNCTKYPKADSSGRNFSEGPTLLEKATSVEEGILEVHPSGGNASSPDLAVECTPRALLLEIPLHLHVQIPAEVAGTSGSSSDKSLSF